MKPKLLLAAGALLVASPSMGVRTLPLFTTEYEVNIRKREPGAIYPLGAAIALLHEAVASS